MLRVLLCILFFCNAAFAQLSVDRAILRFEAGKKPFQNIIVNNSGAEVLYVTTEAVVVKNPGAENDNREVTQELLVSPSRFSVEAKGQRTVRVLLTGEPSDEQKVYRITFYPKGNSPLKEIKKVVGQSSTSLKILTGAGVLLFQDPVEPEPEFDFERSGSDLTFKNNGNVYVLLFDGKNCDPRVSNENDSTCKDLPSNRLYPGKKWSIKTDPSKPVSFKKEILGQYDDLLIPPNS